MRADATAMRAAPTPRLSGRSADAVVQMDVLIDYLDDATEHKEAGQSCGADGHGHAH